MLVIQSADAPQARVEHDVSGQLVLILASQPKVNLFGAHITEQFLFLFFRVLAEVLFN